MIKKGQFLLFFILLLSSCELAKVGDPIIVVDVEDEFYIDWRESLSETQRSLNFMIRTIKEEQCPDATISYNLQQYSLGFKISLNDINSDNNCSQKNAPANVEIPLGYVIKATHQMEIDLKNSVSNEGVLIANSDSYSLNMRTDDGINILNKVLYRVPQNAVWGYINYSQIEEESIALNLLEELKEMGIEQEYLPGYYGHFRIGIGGQVALVDQPISSRLKTFLFTIPNQREALIELSDKIKSQYNGDIKLIMYDDKGWVY